MTSRQRVAVSALVAVAVTVLAGYVVREVQGAWWERLRDAQTAMEANQTALNSARATGQDAARLLAQCTAAVRAYDQAATHLALAQLNPSTECTP